MSEETKALESMIGEEYKYGFTTEVEYEDFPKGLNEEIIKELSQRKDEPEWMLDFRLKSYRAWKEMEEPEWFNATYKKPDFENLLCYSAPKKRPSLDSLDDVDPNIRETYEKLGIPLEEQKMLAGVAVDAVFEIVLWHDMTGPAHQVFEQREFAPGQGDRSVVNGDFPVHRIENDIADFEACAQRA